MARRQHLTLMVVLAVVAFLSLTWLMSGSPTDANPPFTPASPPLEKSGDDVKPAAKVDSTEKGDFGLPGSILTGGAIAPKLANATAKAELGRASWKLLHTMMARFPEEPTADDSLALKTYIQLFARLYPCGDCAAHFQKLLAKFPPQTSSRNAAAGWACFVHNQVNERLKKPIFDCNKIGDFYDCGCGEEGKDGEGKKDVKETSADGELKEREGEKREAEANVPVEKEGLTSGD